MLPLFVTKTSVVAGHQKHCFINFNVINNNNKQTTNNTDRRIKVGATIYRYFEPIKDKTNK
jgi:hypothetical protein